MIGGDGVRYALIANAADKETAFDIKKIYTGTAVDVESGDKVSILSLGAWEAVLVAIL